MADETFKYPNATSPTKTLTFNVTAHSLGDSINIVANQITSTTQGGVRLTENLGSHFTRYDYTGVIYVSSASTDYADVVEFFGSSYANMAEKSFVWTEHNSTAHTVRMISGLSFTNLGNNLMRVSMTLEDSNS